MTIPDDLSQLILVSIRIPGLELDPENPWLLVDVLAGGVLGDLLSVELAAENLLTHRPISGPQSFTGFFMFAVEDVRTAGVIIRAVLQRNGLESFATVFKCCPEDQVWESIYPPGLTMLHAHLVAESTARSAKAREAFALWKRLQESLKPSDNDATPK